MSDVLDVKKLDGFRNEKFTGEYKGYLKRFEGTTFQGCLFRGCYFYGSVFDGSVFKNCFFDGVVFERCLLQVCEFIDCKFTSVNFSSFSMNDFTKTKFCNCFFDYSTDFGRSYMEGVVFDEKCTMNGNIGSYSMLGVEEKPKIRMVCPEEGSFIGYKKVVNAKRDYAVAKLLITDDAERSSSTGRKCRCSKAKVIGFFDCNTREEVGEHSTFKSMFDPKFTYRKGDTVFPEFVFNPDRWEGCTSGIHFFMTFDEAANYEYK